MTNRITDALKAYFPQVLEWFSDKEAAIFADFLERWPTLRHAQRARRETLQAFFRAGNVRSAASIEKRIKAIAEERSLHTDEAVIGPARLLVEALLPQLRVLSEGIARFEVRIAELAPRQPDYPFFDDLPGAGPTFAARLLVAFGEHRERFPTASSLQKSAGIAPVMERSGNKAWVHWRYGCSKFVDPHPTPLLARPRSVRRIPLPHGAAKARRTPAQTRRSNRLIRLADHLRV